MKITISKIKVLPNKTDKRGKEYKPCVIESDDLQEAHWMNIYNTPQDKVVLLWKEGDVVDVELTQNGEFHNFKPFSPKNEVRTAAKTNGFTSKSTYKPVSQAEPIKMTSQNSEGYKGQISGEEILAFLRQIDAKIGGLKTFIENEFDKFNPLN